MLCYDMLCYDMLCYLFIYLFNYLFANLFSGTGDNDWDFREYDEYGNKNNQSIFDRRIDGDFTVWQTGSRLTEEGIR